MELANGLPGLLLRLLGCTLDRHESLLHQANELIPCLGGLGAGHNMVCQPSKLAYFWEHNTILKVVTAVYIIHANQTPPLN